MTIPTTMCAAAITRRGGPEVLWLHESRAPEIAHAMTLAHSEAEL
jgi:hypothetical protein